ncbi:MAG TPA: hypothetical protein GX003_01780 [Acholeplasmataceae bacterium]|jgi:hypothetical protein|nr:hypothetical protein [Acholeplasmataceae bacterium]
MKLKLLRKFYLGFIVLIGVFLLGARVVKGLTPEEIVIHYYRYNNIDQPHNAWVWQDQPNISDKATNNANITFLTFFIPILLPLI